MRVGSGNVNNCSSSLLGLSCILAPFADVLILDHTGRSLSQNALLLSCTLFVSLCVHIYIDIDMPSFIYWTVFLSFRL